jgi:NAD-dependent dihydropyrimidine dehydrogenase PreA subunit
MIKRVQKMKNKIRVYFQFIVIVLILYVATRPFFDKVYIADFEMYCPFGGISSFFSKINQNSMACNMGEAQVMLGLGLLLGAGLIGKLFCSFICPIGTASEWLGKLGRRLKFQKAIPEKIDRCLRGLKYILLFMSIYFTMASSELFCKKFDPYFSTMSLFGNIDIVLYYAIPALLFTIAGALFLRVAWCKYLCPLGAASNIFLNLSATVSVIIIYILANYVGAQLSVVWLLAGLTVAGLINETVFMRSIFLPLPKVVRDLKGCTNCGNCDSKCPQGIKVSEMPVVNHIDCNLCTDCIYSCPFKNVLTINKKKQYHYFAPVSVIILVAVSLGMANYYEFTTISLRWGSPAAKGAIYEHAVFKTIKCYGSSMALAGTLESIEGIYGLDTYAQSHKIKIYYDPIVISENQVKSALFTPSKTEVRKIINERDSVYVLDIGIYGLFDAVDFDNLKLLLQETKGILGFSTMFGEPVKTTIYYYNSVISAEKIAKHLEKKKFLVKTISGEEEIISGFTPENSGTVRKAITPEEYLKMIFNNYDDTYNSYESYDTHDLSVYRFPMPEVVKPELRKYLEYLSSHLSGNEGIVRFSIRYDKGATGYVYYFPIKTTEEAVRDALRQEMLSFYVTESEREEIKNPFQIQPVGQSYKASEVIIDEGR